MTQWTNKKILIVGLGLIGGSYAKALKKAGVSCNGLSDKQEDIDYAIKHNLIEKGTVNVEKEFIAQHDIIIFCLYPTVFLEWIKNHSSYFKEGTILTDVSGVKEAIVETIQELLPPKVEFIACHPMAGKEVSGIQNSDETIFMDANFIITPTKNNKESSIQLCKDLATLMKFKNISILSPKHHDEMIAFLSQLTHCIAVSLMCCKASSHLVEYTGDSFRDLTRIARINENMWSELFLLNKNELLSQMDLFLKEFEKLKNAIDQEDVLTMKAMMQLSSKRRSYFNK